MNADRCNFNSYAIPVVNGTDGRKACPKLVNGTDGRKACPKHWAAILVHANCEKSVAANLDRLGIEDYLPIQQEEHQWSGRKKKIDRVVIPMVVFVPLARNEEEEFRRLPFILKFITCPGAKELATPIPDEQIERLKFLLHNADAKISIVENLKAGDKVRLVRGPMRGLEGELCYMLYRRKQARRRHQDRRVGICLNVEKANWELI